MKIAIMGATSHIAKGLVYRFLKGRKDHLYLFVRSAEKIESFLEATGTRGSGNYSVCADYREFPSFSYDAIINCVGVETRNKDNCDFTRYFTVTETFDNLAIGYLKDINPSALYISFSSGAVYGKGFSNPADESSENRVLVNGVVPEDFYGIVRLNAEAKHRAYQDLRIVDLRIFSYFSRYINLSDGYFITDVMQAILHGKTLITDSTNIVRDYLHPQDLFSMIVKCIEAGKINQAIDVSSSRPAAKQEILDYFASSYGLEYQRQDFSENRSATGAKTNYFSTCDRASGLGYIPRFSSMDTIREEAGSILSQKVEFAKGALH